MAQTSDRVSKLAARFMRMDADTLLALTATDVSRRQLLTDIRTVAASALRQDEAKGVRRFLKAAFGR